MEEKDHQEKPCIFLMFTDFVPAITTIPAVRAQRAAVECGCEVEKECPKKKVARSGEPKIRITGHCFRIRRPPRKKKITGRS